MELFVSRLRGSARARVELDRVRRRLSVGDPGSTSATPAVPPSFVLALWLLLLARLSIGGPPVAVASTVGLMILALSSVSSAFPRSQRVVAMVLLLGATLMLRSSPDPGRPELGSGVIVAIVEGQIDRWQVEPNRRFGTLRDVRVMPRRRLATRSLTELEWRLDEMFVSVSGSVSGSVAGSASGGGETPASLRTQPVSSTSKPALQSGCFRFLGVVRERRFTHNAPLETARRAGLMLTVPSPRLVGRCTPGTGRALGSGLTLVRWVERRLWPPGQSCGPGCSLARALLLGDRSGFPRELRWQMRRTGLSHLLAVSGLHVGLLVGVALCVPGLVRWRFRSGSRAVVGISVLGLYLAFVGWRSSLVRATGMAVLVVLAPGLARPAGSLGFFSWVVVFMLILEPHQVVEVGFQLTIAATAGIVLVATRRRRELERCGELLAKIMPAPLAIALSRSLVVSVAASMATAPLQVAAFHCLYPSAPLVNLVGIPWTALALATILIAAMLSLSSGIPLESMASLLDLLVLPVEGLARLPRHPLVTLPLELQSVTLAAFGAGVLLTAEGRLLRTLRRQRTSRRLLISAVSFLILWLGMVELEAFSRNRVPEAALEVVVLDVGQGEAILLRSPSFTVLVDGGGWQGGDVASSVLVPALARIRSATVDVMISSHSDWDHCGGLLELATMIPVHQLWLAAPDRRDGCSSRLAEVVSTGGGEVDVLARGMKRFAGDLEFEVLWPTLTEGEAGSNDRSLVLAVRHPLTTLLLTGDIEGKVEQRLVLAGDVVHFDLLKVAHHGSRSSSTPTFLARVRPRLALLSAGRGNRFGHPARERVAWLERRATTVLGTHRHGRIRLVFRPGAPVSIETVTALPETYTGIGAE